MLDALRVVFGSMNYALLAGTPQLPACLDFHCKLVVLQLFSYVSALKAQRIAQEIVGDQPETIAIHQRAAFRECDA